MKTSGAAFHSNCEFCEKIKFDERIFCELNQAAQNNASFKCGAFRPLLRVVSKNGDNVKPGSQREPLKEQDIAHYTESNKFQYKKALAMQKLNRNPDAVIIDLKYHIAWNRAGRKKSGGMESAATAPATAMSNARRQP